MKQWVMAITNKKACTNENQIVDTHLHMESVNNTNTEDEYAALEYNDEDIYALPGDFSDLTDQDHTRASIMSEVGPVLPPRRTTGTDETDMYQDIYAETKESEEQEESIYEDISDLLQLNKITDDEVEYDVGIDINKTTDEENRKTVNRKSAPPVPVRHSSLKKHHKKEPAEETLEEEIYDDINTEDIYNEIQTIENDPLQNQEEIYNEIQTSENDSLENQEEIYNEIQTIENVSLENQEEIYNEIQTTENDSLQNQEEIYDDMNSLSRNDEATNQDNESTRFSTQNRVLLLKARMEQNKPLESKQIDSKSLDINQKLKVLLDKAHKNNTDDNKTKNDIEETKKDVPNVSSIVTNYTQNIKSNSLYRGQKNKVEPKPMVNSDEIEIRNKNFKSNLNSLYKIMDQRKKSEEITKNTEEETYDEIKSTQEDIYESIGSEIKKTPMKDDVKVDDNKKFPTINRPIKPDKFERKTSFPNDVKKEGKKNSFTIKNINKPKNEVEVVEEIYDDINTVKSSQEDIYESIGNEIKKTPMKDNVKLDDKKQYPIINRPIKPDKFDRKTSFLNDVKKEGKKNSFTFKNINKPKNEVVEVEERHMNKVQLNSDNIKKLQDAIKDKIKPPIEKSNEDKTIKRPTKTPKPNKLINK